MRLLLLWFFKLSSFTKKLKKELKKKVRKWGERIARPFGQRINAYFQSKAAADDQALSTRFSDLEQSNGNFCNHVSVLLWKCVCVEGERWESVCWGVSLSALHFSLFMTVIHIYVCVCVCVDVHAPSCQTFCTMLPLSLLILSQNLFFSAHLLILKAIAFQSPKYCQFCVLVHQLKSTYFKALSPPSPSSSACQMWRCS